MNCELDQFYTRDDIAERCWKSMYDVLGALDIKNTRFVEPSAGDGAFYRLLPKRKRIGLDLVPRARGIRKQDFLRWKAPSLDRRKTVVVGNPPFGKRGRLAIEFFLRASLFADTIGFIVPVIFRKHNVHRQLPSGFRLIHQLPLPRDAFRLTNGKTYSVNTEFQVWTKRASSHKDRRLFRPPAIRHPDFVLWQYNNTVDALKMFDNPFDFAVPCQGWQDYTRREKRSRDCEKNKQWMLIKAGSPTVLKRLSKEIDYEELALRCTTAVPGFRKGDLVTEYIRRYE